MRIMKLKLIPVIAAFALLTGCGSAGYLVQHATPIGVGIGLITAGASVYGAMLGRDNAKLSQEAHQIDMRIKLASMEEKCVGHLLTSNYFMTSYCAPFNQIDICKKVHASYGSATPPTCKSTLIRAGYRVS